MQQKPVAQQSDAKPEIEEEKQCKASSENSKVQAQEHTDKVATSPEEEKKEEFNKGPEGLQQD